MRRTSSSPKIRNGEAYRRHLRMEKGTTPQNLERPARAMSYSTNPPESTTDYTEEPESVQAARAIRQIEKTVTQLVGAAVMSRRNITEAPPLLVQLRMAVASSQGAGGGGGSSPRERNTLDLSAVELLDRIDAAARKILEEVSPTENAALPTSVLAKVSILPEAVSGQGLEFLTYVHRTVTGWAEQILYRFTPDRVTDIAARCPACKIRTVTVEDAQYTGAKLIPRAALAFNATQNYTGCRSCHATWEGPEGMDQLKADYAKDLEEQATELEATEFTGQYAVTADA